MKRCLSGLFLGILMYGCADQQLEKKSGYAFVSPHIKDGRQRVSNDRNFGFIDPKGVEVVPLKYDYANDFSEGLAMVSSYTGEGQLKTIACGFIDTLGREVIPLSYRQAQDFSEALAAVMNDDGKWGYINQKGEIVIAFLFDDAGPFEQGNALVKQDGHSGTIDRTGNMK